MRRTISMAMVTVVLAWLSLPLVAWAFGQRGGGGAGTGYTISDNATARITDCLSAGTDTISLTKVGWLRLKVIDEDTRICYGATTCSSSTGTLYSPGDTELYWNPATQDVACYSAAGTGDVEFVVVNPK